ncbi:UL16-binding protein 1 [Rattus norvegicus]|uniref:UL16-binding protein 1 n=1 Tax=Rattus norvegicus TaxID=10116 RepID=UPI002FD7C94A
MMSLYNQGQLSKAFWEITCGEKHHFMFDSNSITWIMPPTEDRGTIEKWKTNRELEQGLWKFSMGDSPHWFKNFFKNCKEMPRSTVKVPDTTQPTFATQIPPTGNSIQVMAYPQIPSIEISTQPTFTTHGQSIMFWVTVVLAIFTALPRVATIVKKRSYAASW